MVILVASNGVEMEFPNTIFEESTTLADLQDAGFGGNDAIPLTNVNEMSLKQLRKWCDMFVIGAKRKAAEKNAGKHRRHKKENKLRLLTQDEFLYLRSLSKSELFDLMNAANYLAIQEILDSGVIFLASEASQTTSVSEIMKIFE